MIVKDKKQRARGKEQQITVCPLPFGIFAIYLRTFAGNYPNLCP